MNTLETPIIHNEVIKRTVVYSQYAIEFVNLVLHKEITLIIHLFNDQRDNLKTIQYKIEGDEYIQWGDDDSYIETIIQRELQKLNTESPSE
jgi:hypothetical protein